MRFSLEGDDLNAIYRKLRQVDPKMAAALRNGVKRAALPVVQAVKENAEAQGLHRAAAATTVAFSSTSRLGITATIRTDHKKAPMARPLEYGSQGRSIVNRHPVFGHDVWVDQPTRPYFWSAVRRTSPLVGNLIRNEVDAVLRQL